MTTYNVPPVNNTGADREPVCRNKKCRSKRVVKKGRRTNKGYEVQKYQCNDCRKWFSINSRKEWTDEEQEGFVHAYYHSVIGQEQMPDNVKVVTLAELGKLTGLSKPALSRRIRKIVASMEDGLDTTKRKLHKLGRVLVVDSKHIQIKGHKYYCWLAVDASTGEPIHFALSNSKSKKVIRRFLNQLRYEGGYQADAIVADMEESILKEGEEIFTDEKTGKKPLLQGCAVHRLRQIGREWPSLRWKGRPKLGKKDRKSRRRR